MSNRMVDSTVRAMLDEASMLPDCASKDTLLEQAAARAEALGDLESAWDARVRILSSTGSHSAPRFSNLFLCLAWCLAVSDREPDRFDVQQVLWQYKWVVTGAPRYASVPRPVLDRLVEDLDARFRRAGWGARAGVHKRMDLASLLGEPERALAMVLRWKATPRDRGSDCQACELDSLVGLYIDTGQFEQALREAGPILRRRLSCSTVPHSTYGELLVPMVRLGRVSEARELYQRGRRLVGEMTQGMTKLAGPYLMFAGYLGDGPAVESLLKLEQAFDGGLVSDLDRVRWHARAAVALGFLIEKGVDIELPAGGPTTMKDAARAHQSRAEQHAQALDRRNGNGVLTAWVRGLAGSMPV